MKSLYLGLTLFFFSLININAQSVSINAQSIKVINNDGVLFTDPYSPVTNIQIYEGQYAFGEGDLMCYAVREGNTIGIVILKPNFENKPFPEGMKVIFSNGNNSETVGFKPQTDTNDGKDYMFCSIDPNHIQKFMNTQYSTISLKYPSGIVVNYPIHYKSAFKNHLNKLL